MTRIAVVEAPDRLGSDLAGLDSQVAALRADVCLLGEAPFGPWAARAPAYNPAKARQSVALHKAGLKSLTRLACKAVFSTRPRLGEGGRLINEAFVLQNGAYRALHQKQVFPDEPGFYEARWFEPGPLHFGVLDIADLRIGVIICSELMFPELARQYRNLGANVLLVPRATGQTSVEDWITVARSAAFVSGCYVLSSNRTGAGFGGVGFVIAPNGDEILRTEPDNPAQAVDIDLSHITETRRHYPHTIKSYLNSALPDGA